MRIDPIRRQSIISFSSTITLTIVGFISTMYFAHALGPGIYGAYSLFLAYFGIFNLIGDGGFGGAAVKRISEGQEQNEYFSAFLVLRVLLLVVSVTALLTARPFFVDLDGSGMFSWLLLALIISVFASAGAGGVYGTGKVGISQTINTLNSISKVVLQVIAVFLGYGAAGLAGGFVAGMLAGGLMSLRFLDLRLVRFGRKHLKSLFSFSFWIFLSSAGAMVFAYTDTILIGYFMGNTEIGIYRIAFQFTAAATFTTVALHTVLYPKISNWHAKNEIKQIETSLSRAFTYSLLLAVPVCVGGWILGDRMLYYFYGASFVKGATVLAILLLVQVVNVFMYLQTMSLNAIDRPKDSFRVTAIASVINIILNLLLIPVIGITGAAVATLITMTVNAALAHRALSRIIDVRLEKGPVQNILIATLAMGLFVLLFRWFIPLTNIAVVLLAVAIGGLIYGIILLKLDRGIHDELQDLSVQLGLSWPRWL